MHHNLKAYSPADVKESTNTLWNAKLLFYCSKAALHYPDEAVIYFELQNTNSVYLILILHYLGFWLIQYVVLQAPWKKII